MPESVVQRARELLAQDELMGSMADRFDEILSPERHIGRAPEQVAAFIKDEVDPLLERYAGIEQVTGRCSQRSTRPWPPSSPPCG